MALVTGDFSLKALARVLETESPAGLGGASLPYLHQFDFSEVIPNGTGASTQDIVYSERKTLTAAYTIDLAGGATSVVAKSAQTMAYLTAIIWRNLSTTPGETVTLGGGASQVSTVFGAAGDDIDIGPGGIFIATNFVDGWAVTASTADKLQWTPAVNPTIIDILLIGRSA